MCSEDTQNCGGELVSRDLRFCFRKYSNIRSEAVHELALKSFKQYPNCLYYLVLQLVVFPWLSLVAYLRKPSSDK